MFWDILEWRGKGKNQEKGFWLEQLMMGRLRNEWVSGYKSSILFETFSF